RSAYVASRVTSRANARDELASSDNALTPVTIVVASVTHLSGRRDLETASATTHATASEPGIQYRSCVAGWTSSENTTRASGTATCDSNSQLPLPGAELRVVF